jgi:Flp pilus assembly pilin Flp
MRFIARLAADESADSLVEYALVLASVSIICMAAFNALAQASSRTMATNANNFANSNLQNFAPPAP